MSCGGVLERASGPEGMLWLDGMLRLEGTNNDGSCLRQRCPGIVTYANGGFDSWDNMAVLENDGRRGDVAGSRSVISMWVTARREKDPKRCRGYKHRVDVNGLRQ